MEGEKPDWNLLQSNHKKSADLLRQHVEKLVGMYGIDTVGFLTLTFPDSVRDSKEAGRRINSFLTNYIRPNFTDYVSVLERFKSGVIHFHLLIPVGADIRTGYDHEAAANEDYRSASPFLRGLWSDFRDVCPRYGFGRHELEPIKSTTDAIACYVGKYIGKHIEQRTEADKGVRLVRCSKGVRAGNTRFSFYNPGARLWRAKVEAIAQELALDYQGLIDRLGRHWMYHNQEIIVSTIPDYRNFTEDEQNKDCFLNGPKVPASKILSFMQEMRSYFGYDVFPLLPSQAVAAINYRMAAKAEARNPRYCYTEEERAIARFNRMEESSTWNM